VVHRSEECLAAKWLQAANDLNNDGRDDWIVICDLGGASGIGVIYGGSEASAFLSEFWPLTLLISYVSPPLDLEHDGSVEFLLGTIAGAPYIWRYGDDASSDLERAFLFGAGSFSIDAADHNGDGYADAVAGNAIEAYQ